MEEKNRHDGVRVFQVALVLVGVLATICGIGAPVLLVVVVPLDLLIASRIKWMNENMRAGRGAFTSSPEVIAKKEAKKEAKAEKAGERRREKARKAEERRLANEKAVEEYRIVKAEKAEKNRLEKEAKAEERSLAKKRKAEMAEERRQAIAREAEERRSEKERERAERSRIKEQKARQAFLDRAPINVFHVSGLPLQQGAACSLHSDESSYAIESGALKFNLAKGKVVDVTRKTETEIQQQYVSSIGRAALGGVIAGPIGIIVGGLAQKKTVSEETREYLFITWEDDGELKCVAFENREPITWGKQDFSLLVKEFKKGEGFAPSYVREL